MPRIVFVLPDGQRAAVDVPDGTTLLEAARLANVKIEGACGGNMACATCHVHLTAEAFASVPKPSPEEADMLDFAEGWTPLSRLGCQVRASAAVDDRPVTVPASTLLDW